MASNDQLVPVEKRQPIHSRERVRFNHRVAHGHMQDKLILTLAPEVELELIRIPAGEFLMGSLPGDPLAYDDEMPQHKVYLLDYFIGKTPVTNAQFDAFARATGQPVHALEGEVDPKINHPVTQVSWNDAYAFCMWVSKLKGLWVRLPSEAEWEKAARGADARTWSWGNQTPSSELCNIESPEKITMPVGTYSPQGDSVYGCADMIGNTWEWTRSLFKLYPYQPDDGREHSGDLGMRVVRGGSFFSKPNRARCASRLRQPPNNRFERDIGFRVCALITPPDFNTL